MALPPLSLGRLLQDNSYMITAQHGLTLFTREAKQCSKRPLKSYVSVLENQVHVHLQSRSFPFPVEQQQCSSCHN